MNLKGCCARCGHIGDENILNFITMIILRGIGKITWIIVSKEFDDP